MASGLPDWKLALNVDGQQSGYLTSRPAYGAATLVSYAGNCSALDSKLMVSVAGRGVIYGGFISVNTAQLQDTDFCLGTCDGNNFIGSNFTWCNDRSLTHEFMDFFFLQKFDNVNFIYVFGITRWFTFEESVSVYYAETKGNTFAINCKLFYALRS